MNGLSICGRSLLSLAGLTVGYGPRRSNVERKTATRPFTVQLYLQARLLISLLVPQRYLRPAQWFVGFKRYSPVCLPDNILCVLSVTSATPASGCGPPFATTPKSKPSLPVGRIGLPCPGAGSPGTGSRGAARTGCTTRTGRPWNWYCSNWSVCHLYLYCWNLYR